MTEWKSRDIFLPKWWDAPNREITMAYIFLGVISLVELLLSLVSLWLLPSAVYSLTPSLPLLVLPPPPQIDTPNGRLQFCQNHVSECCASCVDLCGILSCDLPLNVKPWQPVLASRVFGVAFSLIPCFCRELLNL